MKTDASKMSSRTKSKVTPKRPLKRIVQPKQKKSLDSYQVTWC